MVVCGGVHVNWFYYWKSTMKLAVGSVYQYQPYKSRL